MTTHQERIAAFITDTPKSAIPPEAIERAKHALVDLLGVAIAGTVEPVAKIIGRHVERASRGNSTVIGQPFRASAADAALANATTGHALDFDDSSFVLGGHPTVTTMSALLAVAEERGASGADVLDAYVVGYEVMAKMGRAVHFEHYDKGWHPTATLGVFGTTAAVCRLMKLPTEVVNTAIALAASMSSGIKANFGAMSKPFQVGNASRNGVVCAQLAADGLTASPNALEGRQGFLDVYNGEGKYRAEAMSDFGGTLEILDPGLAFKKYPCCGATHAPIDAALELVRQGPVRPADVEAIKIELNRRRLAHTDRPVVSTGLGGKFSLYYTVTAALADGAIGLRQFSDEAVQRPEIQQMIQRTKAVGVERDAMSQACEITVTLRSGEKRSVKLEDAEGRTAKDYPRYMKTKFIDCVEQAHDRAFGEALFERLMSFERENVAQVMQGLGKGAQ